jgi:epoxyqueuosine reductase
MKNKTGRPEIMPHGQRIIEIAIEKGAALAGIASVEALRSSASHLIYSQMGDYAGTGTVRDDDSLSYNQLFNWPDTAKSILVIGLPHPEDQPELDWWDGRGTPGNRLLIDIINLTRDQIEDELSVGTRPLHYYVEKGGIFLKDAAVLAGFGCIGKNNMLVTPAYGPRIRLRALFLEAEIDPTGPFAFDPCADCKVYCRMVCPENAMNAKAPVFDAIDASLDLPARDGTYDRDVCNIQMEKDILESRKNSMDESMPIKYCRKCEFVCPAGK